MKKVLIPLPGYGADPTEVSVPWQLLTRAGIDVRFATPTGEKASPDSKMLNGSRLGIWRSLLKARNDAVLACQAMQASKEYLQPVAYDALSEHDFDGLLLPGGHDKGMREYLESRQLQALVVDFFRANKPVGAICHGVVLAARSVDPDTGESVLHSYKTTALLKTQERMAYHLTRLWLKDYYLTYPETTVEEEVASVLKHKTDFLKGPTPLLRDARENLQRGFVVRDRNYVSARWPGDVHNFALAYLQMLDNTAQNNA